LLSKAKVYPTPIRATGLGTASAFSRFAAFLTPYVVAAFGVNGIVPIILFATSCVAGGIASILLPVETSKTELK
jgi:hypothetical protein